MKIDLRLPQVKEFNSFTHSKISCMNFFNVDSEVDYIGMYAEGWQALLIGS